MVLELDKIISPCLTQKNNISDSKKYGQGNGSEIFFLFMFRRT